MLTNKEIANLLYKTAVSFPEYSDKEPEVVLRVGTFRIKCRPERRAVQAVADKFDKRQSFVTKWRHTVPIHRESLAVVRKRYKNDADCAQFGAA
jgi:hypothetical protein